MDRFNYFFESLIEKLNGRKSTLKLLKISSSALSNYKKRKFIPLEKQVIIKNYLIKKNWEVDFTNHTTININYSYSILMIITGGIAAYKSLDLCRMLIKKGYKIKIIMTKNAKEFVSPLSFAALSNEKVYTDLFSLIDETEMGHINLARSNDLILVVPCTANFISKLAIGIADDLASSVCLASRSPILIAPSMNPEMYKNQVIQDNLYTIKKRGIDTVGPEVGSTACNEVGLGRLSNLDNIISKVDNILNYNKFPLSLSGKKILITSGPTQEKIDPVRYLTNRSSGKQGNAIARECLERGASVTIVSGPVAVNYPKKAKIINVETASDMLKECLKSLPVDIAICVAAVSDWTAEKYSIKKLKKEQSIKSISLEKTPDILQNLTKSKKKPKFTVGFAAETENLKNFATKKFQKKNCDLLVGNLINQLGENQVFGSDYNKICLISKLGYEDLPILRKSEVAKLILDKIEKLLE